VPAKENFTKNFLELCRRFFLKVKFNYLFLSKQKFLKIKIYNEQKSENIYVRLNKFTSYIKRKYEMKQKSILMTDDFEKLFCCWLNQAFENVLPIEIKAFCFNLYLPAGYEDIVKFGIEIVGFKRYDSEDPDWACPPEDWGREPEQQELFLPISYTTEDWSTCLLKMKNLIEDFLSLNNQTAKRLKQSEVIAIGFVNGDLMLIWDGKDVDSLLE
jgi:hypothetical protein